LARLLAATERPGPDELALLALIADRLLLGRRCYGELRLATDRRDFHREALEEAADLAVYAAIPAALRGSEQATKADGEQL